MQSNEVMICEAIGCHMSGNWTGSVLSDTETNPVSSELNSALAAYLTPTREAENLRSTEEKREERRGAQRCPRGQMLSNIVRRRQCP